MDKHAVLAAFNEQMRRHPQPDGPDAHIERDDNVVRSVSTGDGWAGVTWSELNDANADAVIAAQIDRFAAEATPWEWKHYSYDKPADLPERLIAAGFVAQPTEAVLVADIADLDLTVPAPDGITITQVRNENDAAALVSVHNAVFGGDHSAVARTILAQQPDTMLAMIAWAGKTSGKTPVSSARVEFHHGTEFASLWGGGTLPDWRRRGIFRALVAYRAALATELGYRYLQVDATTDSQPILRRLGFVDLATTTPFLHPGRPATPPPPRQSVRE